MAASTDQTAPRAILDGIRRVKAELPGVRTVLGVSNISFGLPFRSLVNGTFLAAAFSAGLDLAIVNPNVTRMMDVVDSWRVLTGEDESAQHYVAHYADRSDVVGMPAPASATSESATAAVAPAAPATPERRVFDLVLAGRRGPVPDAVREVLADHDLFYAIDEVLIPALDEVGVRFERGTFFLPQLMGIEHALLPEQGIVVPGDLVIGADSHTCTYGGIGAFSTGVGSTDAGVGMATGRAWFKVPETIRFVIDGELPAGACAKDVILYVIGMIGVDGALYCAMRRTATPARRGARASCLPRPVLEPRTS